MGWMLMIAWSDPTIPVSNWHGVRRWKLRLEFPGINILPSMLLFANGKK